MSLIPRLGAGPGLLENALPCYPGYAIGGVIRTAELEYPHLCQMRTSFEVHQIKLDDALRKIPKRVEEASARAKATNQSAMLTHQKKVVEKKIEHLQKKIGKIEKEQLEFPMVNELLSVNYEASGVKIRDLAAESENMHYVILERSNAKSELAKFANHLTRSHYSPTVADLVDQVASAIMDLTTQEQRVVVLGSFITLSRVKSLDPVVLREDHRVSQELMTNVNKYSVITQAVLGGVFIGFGSYVSGEQEALGPTSQRVEQATSKVDIFSYVSQGTIPMNTEGKLWPTYVDWRTRLVQDRESGFPIAFKVRKLADIFLENDIALPEE